MFPKIDPGDWDKLFAPNAPRRGGPLRVLGYSLIALVVLALIGFGTSFALARRDAQMATAIANATMLAATAQPQQTATAQAIAQATASHLENRTATAQAKVLLGLGSVIHGGNLRSAPNIDPTTVLGLIYEGDQIAFLEEKSIAGQQWYRIRITSEAANRPAPGVPINTEGWASASLLSAITKP